MIVGNRGTPLLRGTKPIGLYGYDCVRAYAIVSDIVPQNSTQYDLKYYSTQNEGGLIAHSWESVPVSGYWFEGDAGVILSKNWQMNRAGGVWINTADLSDGVSCDYYYFETDEPYPSAGFIWPSKRFLPPRTAQSGYMVLLFDKDVPDNKLYNAIDSAYATIELSNQYRTANTTAESAKVYPEYARILYYNSMPQPNYRYDHINILTNCSRYDETDNCFADNIQNDNLGEYRDWTWMGDKIDTVSTNIIVKSGVSNNVSAIEASLLGTATNIFANSASALSGTILSNFSGDRLSIIRPASALITTSLGGSANVSNVTSNYFGAEYSGVSADIRNVSGLTGGTLGHSYSGNYPYTDNNCYINGHYGINYGVGSANHCSAKFSGPSTFSNFSEVITMEPHISGGFSAYYEVTGWSSKKTWGAYNILTSAYDGSASASGAGLTFTASGDVGTIIPLLQQTGTIPVGLRFVTTTSNQGGIVKATPETGFNGDPITLSYTADQDYYFDNFYRISTGNDDYTAVKGGNITLGNKDITAAATFVKYWDNTPGLSYGGVSAAYVGATAYVIDEDIESANVSAYVNNAYVPPNLSPLSTVKFGDTVKLLANSSFTATGYDDEEYEDTYYEQEFNLSSYQSGYREQGGFYRTFWNNIPTNTITVYSHTDNYVRLRACYIAGQKTYPNG